MAKPNPVVHFEMGYLDMERMMKFYQSVFGWNTKPMGPGMGGYVLAQTTPTDDQGMVQTPGNINGGFYQKTDDPTSQAPSVVISVDDMKAAMDDIVKNGGKLLGVWDPKENKKTMEPQMIPGVGLWMTAQDTEGNRFSIIQP